VDAEILEVRPETADASTLAMRVTSSEFRYRPGQWITVDPRQFPEIASALRERAERRGKPEGPGYFAIASDTLRPGYLEITVKASERPGGSPLSGHLARGLRPGSKVAIEGPGGRYGYPEPLPPGTRGVVHVCAGSGAAPNRGLIRDALGRGWPLKHLLILQDRRPEDRLYRREWEALEATRKDAFRLRAAHSANGEYVSAALIAEAAKGFVELPACLGLVCGPNEPRGGRPGFIDLAKASLVEAGVPADRVFA
jgi:ferredoxin-NADP reductase